MTTYTDPEEPDVVTDHDPTGVQWIVGNVMADGLDEHDVAAPGQTHRTSFLPIEQVRTKGGLQVFATRPTRTDAVAMLDPTCPVDFEDWRAYALVPAQVPRDGDVRPAGDPWTDLLSAIALAGGRENSSSIFPLTAAHGQVRLNADPDDFTTTEVAQLAVWGFEPRGGAFVSIRFGGQTWR